MPCHMHSVTSLIHSVGFWCAACMQYIHVYILTHHYIIVLYSNPGAVPSDQSLNYSTKHWHSTHVMKHCVTEWGQSLVIKV